MKDLGTFGRVRLIRHKNTSKYYAAKILKKHEIIKSKQIDHVQGETEILASICHPFVVRCS
jgi:serine/threonine protein kinase